MANGLGNSFPLPCNFAGRFRASMMPISTNLPIAGVKRKRRNNSLSSSLFSNRFSVSCWPCTNRPSSLRSGNQAWPILTSSSTEYTGGWMLASAEMSMEQVPNKSASPTISQSYTSTIKLWPSQTPRLWSSNSKVSFHTGASELFTTLVVLFIPFRFSVTYGSDMPERSDEGRCLALTTSTTRSELTYCPR